MNKQKKQYRNIHKDLIESCKRGNPDAQFEIYKLYFKAMYNISFRILNNKQEAEDVMQEAFLKAFRNLDQYREEVSFGAWLKKIVINHSLDKLRQKKTFTESLEELNSEPYEDLPQESEDNPVLDINIIKEEIAALPEGYRIVLNLYLVEGYDHDEISQILGIKASSSRSQYARGRKKLIENLKKRNYE